ncbi:DUF805 domain-containing protein [Erwiniaceae bacterium BAC15a-03b]|uniref:DUF805 domain-containing protein n=1 Tax=Winslowiella arboricola TaxID=2978220 RepID=A0A9J6PII2_9GAMM|nr:DUF805 domain-containing protein [Winslowiella arboricola]MCU5773562.1 DUF805 domain-containing protein [Winslowiella arboricola]MCU5776526.1 DUF805 domain-containing protein [Winslowiella arboricola]
MTLQQWCFSYRGRLGRRDFWIWQAVWLIAMVLLFSLAAYGWLDTQMAAFGVVCLLWPSSAVMVKRLHDRNKKGYWALLVILAWILLAGNWAVLGVSWQWALGRFIPTLIFIMVLLELGVITGTNGDNRFGSAAQPVNYLRKADYQ